MNEQTFSADWLSLREPFDDAARTRAWPSLAPLALGQAADDRRIVDLAAGTGANLRFLAPRLGGNQRWRLVDHDPVLLISARRQLTDWALRRGARVSSDDQQGLTIDAATFKLHAEFVPLDLAAVEPLVAIGDATLVTASALIDLVSVTWLQRWIDACARTGTDVAFALNCAGHAHWRPADEDDVAVARAFSAHHRTNKGFGPAIGPEAADLAAQRLAAAGYTVATADSHWSIDAPSTAMLQAMVDGHARAATEMSDSPEVISRWRGRRQADIEAGRLALVVGHRDLWASADRSAIRRSG